MRLKYHFLIGRHTKGPVYSVKTHVKLQLSLNTTSETIPKQLQSLSRKCNHVCFSVGAHSCLDLSRNSPSL